MLFTLSIFKKKLIPNSLLFRFVLIIIIPVLIGQLVAVYLFYERHWYNVSQNTSHLVAVEIVELIKLLKNKEISKQHGTYLNLEYSIIPNTTFHPQQTSHPKEIEIFKDAIESVLDQEVAIFYDGDKKVTLSLTLNQNLLQIKLPYKSLLNPTTSIFVLWIIFLTLFLLSVSLVFSKNQIRSIIDLTNALETYGVSDKTKKYKPSGAREIRQAGLAFLKMKERIERQNAKRTQLLAMISHDLKTPLTRMKLQVELMPETEEKEELYYDINSMKHMIDSYLDFSRGEGGENFQTLNVRDWIANYIKSKWQGKNISFYGKKSEKCSLIKPHSFERAIANIIGNAFKYANKVKVSVYPKIDNILITIEDNGKGIEEVERDAVFKPFYRADKSRPLDSSAGVGLGLAITKEIINGHYGTITLGEGKSLKGLLVTIKLPIKR